MMWVVVVLLLLQAASNLYLPELNADIINNGVTKGDLNYIWHEGAVMLLVSALLMGSAIGTAYIASMLSMRFGRDLRAAVFTKVQTFSRREVNQFGAPSLITRNTNDVQQIQTLVMMGVTMMLLAPITAIGGIFMALRQDVPLSTLIAIVVPLMAVVIGLILARAVPQFRVMQVRIDTVNRVLREQLTGVRVIRAFVRTDYERQRFSRANEDLMGTTLKVNRLFATLMPALSLIMNMASVAVIWFGGHRVASGDMPIGNLTAFLAYIMQILFSVMMATMMFIMVPRAAASAERINEVLDIVPTVAEPDAAAASHLTDGHVGRVEFRNVVFGYPGAEHPILKDVSFTAEPGVTTAVIGSTGSGKTTLVNLLPRLYDVTGGAVLLDGVDVRALPRQELWQTLGLVPQKSFLFSGTIAENLRVGRPHATEEELWEALTVAQGRDFVAALDDKLEYQIEQGGSNVSGGQRQRLAIARALVRRPSVYVFDDSFSALDYATDARLRAALRHSTSNATVLVVAQRVATIRNAEKIIVLDSGRVVGQGTHDELMQNCPTYHEIVLSQMSEDEAGEHAASATNESEVSA